MKSPLSSSQRETAIQVKENPNGQDLPQEESKQAIMFTGPSIAHAGDVPRIDSVPNVITTTESQLIMQVSDQQVPEPITIEETSKSCSDQEQDKSEVADVVVVEKPTKETIKDEISELIDLEVQQQIAMSKQKERQAAAAVINDALQLAAAPISAEKITNNNYIRD